jgi:AraC-like DNA-binding protein
VFRLKPNEVSDRVRARHAHLKAWTARQQSNVLVRCTATSRPGRARTSRRLGLRALVDPQIGRALSLIHERPEDDWTIESLASKVGMSRSAFAARFAQLVEEPPLTYLTRWRMQKASRLLETSHAGVAEVAKRVGYDAEAAFCKAFRRWIGVAPGAYRRNSNRRVGADRAPADLR